MSTKTLKQIKFNFKKALAFVPDLLCKYYFLKRGDWFQNLFIAGASTKYAYEEKFEKAFTRGMANEPYYPKQLIRYRVYINALMANYAKNLEGDFCSIGISWGVLQRTAFEYTNLSQQKNKLFYLIDSWEKVLTSETSKKISNYCDDYDFICSEFKEPNFKIIRELAPKGCDFVKTPISFLSLNTSDTKVEIDSVAALWDQITTPGFIVIDSYTWNGHDMDAWGKFFEDKNCLRIPLPNGQGIIIKI